MNRLCRKHLADVSLFKLLLVDEPPAVSETYRSVTGAVEQASEDREHEAG